MLLKEIAETHDLRVSTLVKMVQTLIRKKVPVWVQTRYEDGTPIRGKAEGMTLDTGRDDGSVNLIFAVEMPGGWSKPDWTRIKPAEAEHMELKKQKDDSYLLSFPNADWEQLSVKSKVKKRATGFVKSAFGLGSAKDRHSGD